LKKIILKTNKGEESFVPEQQELKDQIAYDRKQNLKEHLYMGYLIIGTLAFTLGIIISLKRLNSAK